jgi:hypothetical protein
MLCHVEDWLGLNKLPLETAQFGGTVANTGVEQAYSDKGTNGSGEAVETSTLIYCSGVPTRRSKVLHGPSLPSLYSISSHQHTAQWSHFKEPSGKPTSIDWQESRWPGMESHMRVRGQRKVPASRLWSNASWPRSLHWYLAGIKASSCKRNMIVIF